MNYAERQFVWGLRYVDDIVVRNRDTNDDGLLDERLFGTQDANWSVTTLIDFAGELLERLNYTPYGTTLYLTSAFAPRSSSNFDWEYLISANRVDALSDLYQVRNRWSSPELGNWITRDPIGLSRITNLYEYLSSLPMMNVDPFGLTPIRCLCHFTEPLVEVPYDDYAENPRWETVDCTAELAENCCARACAGDRVINWEIVRASSPPQIAPHPCDVIPYLEASDYFGCLACCVHRKSSVINRIPVLVFPFAQRVPKEGRLGFGSSGVTPTVNVVTKFCQDITGKTGGRLVSCGRFAGKVSTWLVIVEGCIDLNIIHHCAGECSIKSWL